MALINTAGYENLAKMATITETKKPGKFFNVNISGKRRGKINAGYFQCAKAFDSDTYFILNESEVYFLPLYIKRYWVKYKKGKNNDGQDIDIMCAFGWEDNSKKPDTDCKYEYLIAGFLWDNTKNSIQKHPEDYEEAGIKSGDPIMIYFRCKGTRCSCAFDLVRKINDKAKNLTPLSDNPTFEQAVVNPRRFLIKTTIESKNFDYNVGGRKQSSTVDIYNFDPIKTIPDENVQQLLEASNKYLPDFNEQFDKSTSVSTASNTQIETSGNSEEEHSDTTSSKKTDVAEEINLETDLNPASNFDLEI